MVEQSPKILASEEKVTTTTITQNGLTLHSILLFPVYVDLPLVLY